MRPKHNPVFGTCKSNPSEVESEAQSKQGKENKTRTLKYSSVAVLSCPFSPPFLLALNKNTISTVWVTGSLGYWKDIWKYKVQTNMVCTNEYKNSYRMLKAWKNKIAEMNFYFILNDWRKILIKALQVCKNFASLQYHC